LTGLYFRFDTRDRGSPVIIGGEDHKTGQEEETESRYKRLKKTLEKTFPHHEAKASLVRSGSRNRGWLAPTSAKSPNINFWPPDFLAME
jgi:hypothetical protein